jgi:hypothetical protein
MKLALASLAFALSTALADDAGLPKPFDPTEVASVMAKSPFNRVVSFEDSYALTGLAQVAGKPLATILNIETKQRFTVTSEPNPQGWVLKSATITGDPKKNGITLVVGGEEVTLRYNKSAEPPPAVNSSRGGPSYTVDANGRRIPNPVDIYKLSDDEVFPKRSDGTQYVRGSLYLPQADREHYYNDMSDTARDSYRQNMMASYDSMKKANPEQRAAIAKKVFEDAKRAR